jgi:hypothetical protein
VFSINEGTLYKFSISADKMVKFEKSTKRLIIEGYGKDKAKKALNKFGKRDWKLIDTKFYLII